MASRKTRLATSSGDRERSDVHPATPSITRAGGDLLVGVRVSPSARRTELRGVYGDRLKVSVSAPPEDNRANQALLDALAGWLGIGRVAVHVHSGHASRDKVVAFSGIDEAELRSRLTGLLEAGRT